jgi:hypothetical protein
LSQSGAEFAAAVEREAQGRARSRNFSVLLRLWPFMKPYRGVIALAGVFLLVAAIASLVRTLGANLPEVHRILIVCGGAARHTGVTHALATRCIERSNCKLASRKGAPLIVSLELDEPQRFASQQDKWVRSANPQSLIAP